MGHVGLVEPHAQQEGLAVVVEQEGPGLLHRLEVGEAAPRLVGQLHRAEEVGVEGGVGAGTDWRVLVLLGGRVVGGLAPAVGLVVTVVTGYTRVEHLGGWGVFCSLLLLHRAYLAHAGGVVALLPEVLRQRGEVAGV